MEVRTLFGRFVWWGINISDVTIHPSRGSKINPTLKVCAHNRVAHASKRTGFVHQELRDFVKMTLSRVSSHWLWLKSSDSVKNLTRVESPFFSTWLESSLSHQKPWLDIDSSHAIIDNLGSICPSERVHLKLAIKEKHIFAYLLFPNISLCIYQWMLLSKQKPLYAYCWILLWIMVKYFVIRKFRVGYMFICRMLKEYMPTFRNAEGVHANLPKCWRGRSTMSASVKESIKMQAEKT